MSETLTTIPIPGPLLFNGTLHAVQLYAFLITTDEAIWLTKYDDLAQVLGVSPASAKRAMNQLREFGYVVALPGRRPDGGIRIMLPANPQFNTEAITEAVA
jgi:DNA-binding IscR family transcriptional regulator